MAAQIDRQVSGNEFRSLVGRTRPFNGPSSYQPDRRQCSVRGRSLLAGVLTLNGTKQSLGLTTGVTTNGGCTRYSGRRHQAVGLRRASSGFSVRFALEARTLPNPIELGHRLRLDHLARPDPRSTQEATLAEVLDLVGVADDVTVQPDAMRQVSERDIL